ncbi:prostaglandin E2 receptor EP1 subtype-like isoform X3 [Thalassophryne amazonica]|uniref:prostaglandin E2 receptor EP1 subtype-like isoform X3 n=1 Tax=Thalassophryne amazonica TaxID=390379 RepID=UPI0014710B12|nr:prostaglandin E2 receptor EP1 subtype-like isoform X3 [Thalassophryne amazonica]
MTNRINLTTNLFISVDFSLQSNHTGIPTSSPLSNRTSVEAEKHNATSRSRGNPTAACLTMTLGIVFNVAALIILAKAYNRFRRRSKATFLFLASSLVVTDLAGHVIPGALVLKRVGTYTFQYPGSWCFIRVLENTELTDLAFTCLFSGLGLSSLAVAFVCNTISGITLVRYKLRKQSCTHRRSARTHDTEMVVQLVGIMVTSCICWSPLLIFGLMSASQSYSGFISNNMDSYRGLLVTGVRMATCNQILDPWVYILLRRAILKKIYHITKRRASFQRSTFRSIRWEISSFQSSDKNNSKKANGLTKT